VAQEGVVLSTDNIYQNRYELIPAELKAVPNWVMFRLEHRVNQLKPAKVPYQPSGDHAKANDPTTWNTFETCLQVVGKFDGIGFEFAPPYIGVDLDKCRDPETGELEEWAQDVIAHFDSYTELSPSGTGVHILCEGTLPPGGRRIGRIEMYDKSRFFTMTGEHLPGTPTVVNDRTEVLVEIHAALFPATVGGPPRTSATVPLSNPSDEEILRAASAAKNGRHFDSLWRGDWQGAYRSQSEADEALCCMLAFWTGKDAVRTDQLFRQSSLYRTKWDREDYRTRTIENAVNRTETSYSASPSQPVTPTLQIPADAPSSAKELLDLIESQSPETFDMQEVTYLVEPEIPKGALVLVTGKPGSGKSTLVLKWCQDMAANGNEILYLDRDNPLFIAQERIERFGGKTFPKMKYWGLWNKNKNGEPLEPPLPNSHLLKDLVKVMKNPVVIIDTFAANSDCDENDNSAVGETFKHLRALTHLGATVIVIHHTGKNATADYRGASSMLGAVDAAVKIVSNIEDGLISSMQVETFKTRIGDGKPLLYKMVNGIPQRETATFADVLMTLLERNQGLTKEKFEDLARKSNFKRSTIRNFIDYGIVGGKLQYENRKLTVKRKTVATPTLLRDIFDEEVA
jgi:archaellum biogenesis ATPase FlaH